MINNIDVRGTVHAEITLSLRVILVNMNSNACTLNVEYVLYNV
jgi:hypothetical protein